MEELLQKLAGLSSAWKAQFQEPYGKYWTEKHFKKPPDLPLEWTVDKEGLLRLDGVWICPVTCIDPNKVLPEDGEYFVTPVSMEIDLKDGCLTVIITKEGGEYEIAGIERSVYHRQAQVIDEVYEALHSGLEK